MKLYRDKEWLREKYLDEKLSSREIAEMIGYDTSTIHKWLVRHSIPRRKAGWPARKVLPVKERFWSKVDIRGEDDCWLWQRSKCYGYGSFRMNSKTHVSHRVAWELTNGPIPDGLCICHKCDVRDCCNPNHLFLGTRAENNADRDAKGRRITMRGEQSGRAKLTNTQVREIRCLYAKGNVSHRRLATMFGVTHSTIGAITRREHWQHIK